MCLRSRWAFAQAECHSPHVAYPIPTAVRGRARPPRRKGAIMRIVSLLPSATEIVYALGLGDSLVGVTHECDYPDDARNKPVVTRSLLDHEDATSEEIDYAVRGQLRDGLSLYELDRDRLAELHPDLILTQALCEVCAVSFDAVERVVCDVTP